MFHWLVYIKFFLTNFYPNETPLFNISEDKLVEEVGTQMREKSAVRGGGIKGMRDTSVL